MKIKNLNKTLIISGALLMQSMVNGADLATRLADPKTRLCPSHSAIDGDGKLCPAGRDGPGGGA